MQFSLRVEAKRWLAATACFSLAAWSAVGVAQAPAATAQGRESYRQYCASCHGEDGRGNGPAAAGMKARPTNLTTIAARKGGFPAADVEAVIKGVVETDPVRPAAPDHEPIPAHGSYAMPVWGPYFTSAASSEAEAQQRLSDLVGYIASIQTK